MQKQRGSEINLYLGKVPNLLFMLGKPGGKLSKLFAKAEQCETGISVNFGI